MLVKDVQKWVSFNKKIKANVNIYLKNIKINERNKNKNDMTQYHLIPNTSSICKKASSYQRSLGKQVDKI